MASHSGSQNKSSSKRDRKSDGSTQMSGKEKDASAQTGSGSALNSPHETRSTPLSIRGGGEMGPMHTNAGSTGFSSDQISPKTQNMPQTGPSASHPAQNKGVSGQKS